MNTNNKRIAKNTLMLYFRMMLFMGVTLYTSRIILEVLGVEDFGIYNVVGGVVVMFGFLNSAMSSATQRFLSFEMGRKDYEQLKKVFSLSVTIHALIAVVIFVLAETIGLWFLNTQLTIPNERIEAANWVYQFSIFAFMVTVMAVPYNAAIISHERMNVYAYVSIVEVVLKLAIVFALQWIGFDKLKLYAVLTFVVSLLIRTIYQIYCTRKFEECTYRFVWDKEEFGFMLKYVSWGFCGHISAIFSTQGINMLLNMFYGPVVNAARGVAYQVIAATNQFVFNFQTSMKPQIVKYYAVGDMNNMFKLVFQGSRFSFYLLFILCFPILFHTHFFLELWLKNVPENTVLFTQLVLINGLIDCLSGTLQKSVMASGKIKIYHIVIGTLLLSNIPISYIFLSLNYPSEIVFYVTIGITLICLFARLLVLRHTISFPIFRYIKAIVLNALIIFVIATIFFNAVNLFFLKKTLSIETNLISVLFSILIAIITILAFGLKKYERKMLISILKKIKNNNNQ